MRSASIRINSDESHQTRKAYHPRMIGTPLGPAWATVLVMLAWLGWGAYAIKIPKNERRWPSWVVARMKVALAIGVIVLVHALG